MADNTASEQVRFSLKPTPGAERMIKEVSDAARAEQGSAYLGGPLSSRVAIPRVETDVVGAQCIICWTVWGDPNGNTWPEHETCGEIGLARTFGHGWSWEPVA